MTLPTSLRRLALANRTKALRKGLPNRRIIASITKNNVETYLHATKGWKARYSPENP